MNVLKNFELIEIDDIRDEDFSGLVYDLEVGGENGDHSYNIDRIVVHNSVCTTRKIAGVGRPQLSTIIDCGNAAHGLGGMICSDGGCTVPADISKAFCANSDFVCLGGMLAAHNESELEPDENGKLKFYGMSSEEAMIKHSGGVAKHRAAEGKLVLLDNRGPVENTILEIQGGLRSTGSYIGAKKIKEFSKRTSFYRVTMQTNDIFGKS
jgi:GMP reductase